MFPSGNFHPEFDETMMPTSAWGRGADTREEGPCPHGKDTFGLSRGVGTPGLWVRSIGQLCDLKQSDSLVSMCLYFDTTQWRLS